MILSFRYYIIGSGVGLLARKTMLVMKLVVESRMTNYRLDPMVLTNDFYCLDQVFLVQQIFFTLKSALFR